MGWGTPPWSRRPATTGRRTSPRRRGARTMPAGAWPRIAWADRGSPRPSAAAWPARALGMEATLGTLAPGRIADVIAVEGDPLDDITAMGRVRLVVSRGRIAYLRPSEERQ